MQRRSEQSAVFLSFISTNAFAFTTSGMRLVNFLFPGLVQNPVRITLIQLTVLVSAFYVFFLGTLTAATWLDGRKGPFLSAVFSDGAYDPLNGSLLRCLSLWISGIPLALLTRKIVRNANACFDYLLCVFVFNLVATTFFSKFPIDYNWYVSFGLHASGVSIFAEWLCGGFGKRKV